MEKKKKKNGLCDLQGSQTDLSKAINLSEERPSYPKPYTPLRLLETRYGNLIQASLIKEKKRWGGEKEPFASVDIIGSWI